MYISTDEIRKLIKNCLDRVPSVPEPETARVYFGIMYSFLKTLNDILGKEEEKND